jgi:hypothetical protein
MAVADEFFDLMKRLYRAAGRIIASRIPSAFSASAGLAYGSMSPCFFMRW